MKFYSNRIEEVIYQDTFQKEEPSLQQLHKIIKEKEKDLIFLEKVVNKIYTGKLSLVQAYNPSYYTQG